MGLFNKKVKDTPNKDIAKLEKQLEMAKKQEEQRLQKEKEREELNSLEEMDQDFVTDDEIEDSDIGKEIEKFVDANGIESTINYLKSIITQLNVQLVLEYLNDGPEQKDEPKEPTINFQE